MIKTVRLDTILKQNGWINDEQIQLGLVYQEQRGCRWGSALVELGVISEDKLTQALCEQYCTPAWEPERFVPDDKAMSLFRERWQRENGVLPLSYDPESRSMHVAITDPGDTVLIDEIKAHTAIDNLTVSAAPEVSLQRIWNLYFGSRSGESLRQSPTQSRDEHSAIGTVLTEPGHDGSQRAVVRGSVANLDIAAITESSMDMMEELCNVADQRPHARVLIWLARRHLAVQIAALLESENCVVDLWDGVTIPNSEWDYLIYDPDNADSRPESLTKLRHELPQIQPVRRSSFTATILRNPLPYERMRDGYLNLAQQLSVQICDDEDAVDAARYATEVAKRFSLLPIETDTIATACSLEFILRRIAPDAADRESFLAKCDCPYPIYDLLTSTLTSEGASDRDRVGVMAGRSLESAVFNVVMAYIDERRQHPITTIEAAAQFGDALLRDRKRHLDPSAIDAMLRVLREEILDSYLPAGPSEVMLVTDHPVDWKDLPVLLKSEGWRLVTASEPTEARSLVGRRQPDAVIWAASGGMEWIRWQSRTAPSITTFLLLESNDSGLSRAAILAGFEDVWSGDWDPVVAAAKLRRAFERRPHPPSSTQSVTGTLSQLGLVEMLQILVSCPRNIFARKSRLRLRVAPASCCGSRFAKIATQTKV